MARRVTVGALGAGAAAALALPCAAGAGGFATVGLSSLPDGTAPGKPWRVQLTILQHGRTPLSGLKPTVRIRSADGRTTRTFAARPAGQRGIYVASVVFPAAGRWRYVVDDGFSQTHTFAPARIGGAGAASGAAPTARASDAPAPQPARPRADDGGGGNVGAALGAGAGAGVLAALLTAALLSRRRPAGAAAEPR